MPDNGLAPPNMPWLWQPNSPLGQPNALGPPMLNYAAPPNPTSQGAGVAAAGQQAWQWLQDQRAESVRQGLLDPNTGLPTQKGLVEGAKATAEGVMMGTTAPGEAPNLSPAERFQDAFDAAHAKSGLADVSNVHFFEHGPNEVEISHIQVDPDKRGQGIGNTLMGTATDLADQHGVTLHASPASDADGSAGLDYEGLRDWYQRWGFDERGGGDRLTRSPSTVAPGDVPPPGIVAYHGSPHSFDRFDSSKIGTGEGNQAFGYGLYAADQESTAQSYKGGGYTFQGKRLDPAASWSPESAAAGWFEPPKPGETMGDMIARRAQELQDHGDFMAGSTDSRNHGSAQMYYNAAERLRGLDPADWKQAGHMYQVNINADPEHFLDWDKPLSEQSQHVQDALGKVPWTEPYLQSGKFPGSQIAPKTPEGAQQLRDAGVAGIRYLDQGSRGARDPIKLVDGKPYDPSDPTHIASHAMDMASGDRTAAAAIADRHAQLRAAEGDTAGADAMRQASTLLQSPRTIPPMSEGQPPGTHNYVVFDPATIEILRKYGLAGLIAGGGAAAAATQQQQPSQ